MAKIQLTKKEKLQFSYKELNGYKPHKYIDPFNERIGRIKRMRGKKNLDFTKRDWSVFLFFPKCWQRKKSVLRRWRKKYQH